MVIPNDNVFLVKTDSGAVFVEAIDICFDHLFGQAQTLIEKTILSKQNTMIVPKNAEYVVSSNKVELLNNPESFYNLITHIDPEYNIAKPMQYDLMKPEDLSSAKKNGYKEMKIEKSANDHCIMVINPPFGSDFKIIATEERQVC